MRTLGWVLTLGLVAIVLCATPASAAPFAYVTNDGLTTVSVIDRATNTVVATVPVGATPVGVAITPDGAFAYVANFGSGTVSVIATATNTVVASVPTGGGAWGVAITPDGALAYVANFGSGTVSVIATATNTVVASIPVGASPLGVAISPDGAFAYVANSGSNTVSVIATASNTVTATVSVGVSPHGVAITPDGTFAYVANSSSGTVSVIATATNTVVATVPVGAVPVGVAITPDGAFAYVANFGSGSVSVIATASNTVVNTVPVVGEPHGLAITPDGAFAYVANFTSNTVSVIATATNTVVNTVPDVGGPIWVAFTPASPVSYANPAASFTSPTIDFNNITKLVGWQFTVNSNITVDSLGFYDNPANGISSSHDIGIYDVATQALVVSGVVSPTDPYSNWFKWASISPTALTAGHTYDIVAILGNDNRTWNPTGISFDPNITYVKNVWSDGVYQLSFPNSSDGNPYGYFGPNFDISNLPTPAPPFPGCLKTSTSYEFSIKQNTQDSQSIQLINTCAVSRSATLDVLNPYSGLTASLSLQSVTVGPGQTQNIPIVINSGSTPVGAYDGLLLKISVDDGTTLYANIKINVVQQSLPDLAISSGDILPAVVNPDNSVTLSAAIHNLGTLAASNVTVRFYDFNNVLGDAVINQVSPNGTVSASITVPMASGNHVVQVVIDPLGTIQEIDKTNNAATQIIQVGSSPPPLQGGILVTGSLPSNVYTGSLFTVSGQAVYDLYVNGTEYTNYVVKGGAVQLTITAAGGTQWVYGDVHTDINGNFSKVLQAPASAGTYHLTMTVTDKTFIGTRDLVFSVSVPPPPGTPPPTNPPSPGPGPSPWGTGHYQSDGAGGWTWVWDQLLVPSVPQSDLAVYSEDIYFSKDNPAPNEEITIIAQIHYWASSSTIVARKIPVNVYVTYPGSPPVQIGQTVIDSLSVVGPDFGSRYVYATWKNQAQGIYLVEVQIDPSYVEANLLNNAATRAIVVGQFQGPPQGAISGQVSNSWGGVGNVIIHVLNASGTQIGNAVTDSTGFYFVANVPVGGMQVHIDTPSGYLPDAATKTVTVSNQSVSAVDFHLSMPGDVNGDGKVDCTDVGIVKASLGKKTGQSGFDPRADVNRDGIVNVVDLAIVAKGLPAGTKCP